MLQSSSILNPMSFLRRHVDSCSCLSPESRTRNIKKGTGKERGFALRRGFHKPVYHMKLCRTTRSFIGVTLFFAKQAVPLYISDLQYFSSTRIKVDGRRMLMFARVEIVVFVFLFLRSGVMPILSHHVLRRSDVLSSWSNRPLATLKLVATSSTSLGAFESTSDVVSDASYLDKKPTDEEVSRLHSFLQSKRNVLVITGAGISTSSGVPDYRGPLGSYKLGTILFTSYELSS